MPLARVYVTEGLHFPVFAGQVREPSALDVGQVSHAQLLARWCDDAASDAVGGGLHDVVDNERRGAGLQCLNSDILRGLVEPFRWPRHVAWLE